MNIYRDNNKIITDWYTKTIASGRLINYHSTQPIKQKINTASNLITKVTQLSDNKFINKNINKIREILSNNSYPTHIINSLIHRVTNGKSRENNKNDTSGNPKKFYSLAYIPKLTENTQLQEIIEDEQVSLAHKANKTINSLFTKTKTKIEKYEQSNVVYEIKCIGKNDEHCGKVYVGTTKRNLNKRMSEHESDIKKGKQTTALAQHCIEYGHTADLQDVKILDKEIKVNKRYTLESLRIQQRTTSAINRKEDKDKTHANYTIAIL